MAGENEREQRERVRERFTRTAGVFANYVLSERHVEADRLVEMAAPLASDRSIDVACGPGTFALRFAPHVRMAVGFDLTPALVAQARAAAAHAGIANLFFAFGDAAALPFPAGAFDIVSCGYSLHHMADPAAVVREFVRVAKPGGRVAVVDVFVPPPGRSEVHTAIERARDSSHTRALDPEELPALLEGAGLRLREVKPSAGVRSFNHWMKVAGWKPGDEAYCATRRLMEDSMDGDTAGFHPRRPAAGAEDFVFVHSALFAVAKKVAR